MDDEERIMNWYKRYKQADWDWSKFNKGMISGGVLGLAMMAGLSSNQLQNLLEKHNYQEQSVRQSIEQMIYQEVQVEPIQQSFDGDPADKPDQSEPQEDSTNHTQESTAQNVDPFVARVIFSEAANADPEERRLVALTMQNRINHIGFGGMSGQPGGLESMREVVNEPNAFEAIGDDDNINWERSANPESLNNEEQQVWQHALQLSKGIQPQNETESEIVYYHDKSLDDPPDNWNNQYWEPLKEIETDNFVFYSIQSKN